MNKDKQIMDEFEIYESLIRKNAKQKYIDCQMDRVIEIIKKSQREEIVEEIEDKYQLVTQSPRDNVVETAKDIGYNSAIREIINLITKEDGTK